MAIIWQIKTKLRHLKIYIMEKNMSQNQFEIPQEMQAIEILEFGGPENLRSGTRPIPKLSNGQVLIKVLFAGVNSARFIAKARQL